MDYCVYCHCQMNRKIHQDRSTYQMNQIHLRCNHPFALHTKLPINCRIGDSKTKEKNKNEKRKWGKKKQIITLTQINRCQSVNLENIKFFSHQTISADSTTSRYSKRNFNFPPIEIRLFFGPNCTFLTF